MRTTLPALFAILLLAGCAAPVESPTVDPSDSPVAAVDPATIENAGIAMVTMPQGYEERAGMNGRGPVGQLVLSGPFYGDRALIAVCDGGNGRIAYAPEGETELEPILVCDGRYGASSRTLALASGYLVFEITGDASMRWHVAVAEPVAIAPSP